MAETGRIEQIVGKVVSQVLEDHLPKVRDEVVRRVLEALRPQLEGQGATTSETAADSGAAGLLKDITAIQSGTTQKEILRALLDGSTQHSGRSALFVVKPGAVTGWEARGFADDDAIKNFALDMNSGLVSRAMQSQVAASGPASEMDAHFVEQFQTPSEYHVLLLPLLVKHRIAALVYADAGQQAGKLDQAALEVLVAATSAWLEVASLRKQSQKEAMAEPAPQPEAVSSYSDPFAGHAPSHAAASASPTVAEPEPVAVGATAAAAEVPTTVSPEEADVHRKAQRFARLLVDEIKLYNQAKVAEGRKNRDIYDRLKEDIEKSRATYMKRYGNTAAASADYFDGELVRSLAEDDSSLMGANFRR